MAELILQAGDDHVARLAHENDPVRAVIELIWNAIDAEANEVSVVLEHDDHLGAITKVAVSDDGHGISVDELAATFGNIGAPGSAWPPGPRTANVISMANAARDACVSSRSEVASSGSATASTPPGFSSASRSVAAPNDDMRFLGMLNR